MPELLDTLREITSSEVNLHSVHPQRLDRWHQTLVGLPHEIYMQLGGYEIFNQVGQGAQTLLTLINLLGEENLPMDPRQLVQRNLQRFSWAVPSGTDEDGDPKTILFQATWLPEEQKWGLQTLRNAEDGPAVLTDSLEAAVDEAREFAKGEG